MRGFPKHINTRKDIEKLMGFLDKEEASSEYIEKGLKFLNGLLNTKQYFFDRELTQDESLDGSYPDYIERTEDGVRKQFKLDEDPNAKLHKLNCTKEEVQNWIDQLNKKIG